MVIGAWPLRAKRAGSNVWKGVGGREVGLGGSKGGRVWKEGGMVWQERGMVWLLGGRVWQVEGRVWREGVGGLVGRQLGFAGGR